MRPLIPPDLPRVLHVLKERIELNAPFVEIAGRFADRPGTVVLLSGGGQDSARFHLLSIEPFVTLRAKGQVATLSWEKSLERSREKQNLNVDANPWDVLDALLEHLGKHLPPADAAHLGDLPVRAGLFGYLGYDLKDSLEKLPQTAADDLDLPDLHLVVPRLLLIQHLESSTTTLLAFLPEGEPREATWRKIDDFWATVEKESPRKKQGTKTLTIQSNFDCAGYVRGVERIREYIAAGDVYQVNLCQRFEAAFDGDAFDFFASLFAANPAPFFAYVNATDHHVVSTSPERFLNLQGGKVETRPIKGTRPRSHDPKQDAHLVEELQRSAKDDAELSMIVDLLRNDLGKVCSPGSVQVTAHKRVESYDNVTHLVSHVEGILEPGKTAVDLLRATFPGGSITGCPKIRAMEIIDELEPVRRHVYTGSIGYIGLEGALDLSIAIRTATITQERIVFSVGAGIVFDSDPNSEYEETLHKGESLISALNGGTVADKSSH